MVQSNSIQPPFDRTGTGVTSGGQRQEKEAHAQLIEGLPVSEVIIDPPPAVRREFQAKKEKYEAYGRELQKTAKLKSATLDKVRFILISVFHRVTDRRVSMPTVYNTVDSGVR